MSGNKRIAAGKRSGGDSFVGGLSKGERESLADVDFTAEDAASGKFLSPLNRLGCNYESLSTRLRGQLFSAARSAGFLGNLSLKCPKQSLPNKKIPERKLFFSKVLTFSRHLWQNI
ncbi:MAG: hypothetical protein JSS81_25090 [Acidobacteria bacterium]|nr:hypothetical protein [Acidobacteriota bacterium]